jgi:hypothetical protein
MRINPILYGFLVLAVFFGVILGFQAAGIWSISGKVTADGEAVQPSAGDVNSIKGWMTLEQIATTFNVSLADLLQQFNLPADTPPSTAIKDLESDTFDTTALRIWLQNPVQPTSVPQSNGSQPTPSENGISTSTQLAQMTPTLAPTEHAAPSRTVTGKTTFQELLDWGVSKEVIQQIIGGDLPTPSTVVKDYVTGKGLEFTAVKSLLQAEVDKLQ